MTQRTPRTILRDGDNFYIYNPKIRRVGNTISAEKIRVPVSFGWFGTSGKSLTESYSIARAGEETLDNHKVLLLEPFCRRPMKVKRHCRKIQLWWTNLPGSGAATIFRDRIGDYFIIR